MNKYLLAEKELAELLGWTFVQPWGDCKIMGKPPVGETDTHIPLWTQDKAAAFDLVDKYKINITFADNWGLSTYIEGQIQGYHHDLADHVDSGTALRYAIVITTIQKLRGYNHDHKATKSEASPSN